MVNLKNENNLPMEGYEYNEQEKTKEKKQELGLINYDVDDSDDGVDWEV